MTDFTLNIYIYRERGREYPEVTYQGHKDVLLMCVGRDIIKGYHKTEYKYSWEGYQGYQGYQGY